jgi:hypothetical protein
MKTKINLNSVEAYRELEKEIPQIERLFKLIKKHGPINSRTLSNISGIEKSAVVARVNKLHKEQKKIEVAFSDKCIITNKKTDFYQVATPKPKPKDPGVQAEIGF